MRPSFIGDVQDQAAHEGEMAAVLVLTTGQSGDLVYAFSELATLEIGCHEPGHYAAGMRASVTVS